MRIFYPDTPDLPLPPGHRFPAGKYRLLRETLQRERLFGDGVLVASPLAGEADVLRAHDADYVDAVLTGTLEIGLARRIGLPWSAVLVERTLAAVGGSLAASRYALAHGWSGQLAGGTHHAHRGFGSGYCVFNDLAVTALTLIEEGAARRVAILDCDVHQGDGTAAILGARADVLTVSIHGEKNFPFRKVASTIDVGLADGTEDAGYLAALADVLPEIATFKPDILLYLSGADALKSDTLGRLALTHEGLAARDRLVLETCRRQGVPVSIAIGGGYAAPIEDSVVAYANTYRVAMEVLGHAGRESGKGWDMVGD